eukprot:4732599-Prymnesium_polylepis.1
MFCTMLTGLPPASGSAAPDCMHALVEQLRRPEIGRPGELYFLSGIRYGIPTPSTEHRASP